MADTQHETHVPTTPTHNSGGLHISSMGRLLSSLSGLLGLLSILVISILAPTLLNRVHSLPTAIRIGMLQPSGRSTWPSPNARKRSKRRRCLFGHGS